NSQISPSEPDWPLPASYVPDAASEEGTLSFAAFKKPKYSSAHRNAPSPFWCLAVWHKNYSLLPVQVFSAGPDSSCPLLRFVRVFSKFVVRHWYSRIHRARRFQPVDEITIPLLDPAARGYAPLLLSDKMPSGLNHVPESFRSTGTAIHQERPASGPRILLARASPN